ncbi:MAG: helix-turn-helix domain-containing protein [Methanothrix sp.]|nr:helix-turn-helix domain-containing protein [Methanothrix sp.]
MKIIRLMGALAVLSLLMVPAFSKPSLIGCSCLPGSCPEKPIESCCSKPSDISLSQSCSCPGLIASYSGMEYCDLGYSYFSKNRPLSSSSSRSVSGSLTSPGNVGAFSSVFSPVSNSVSCNVGPPDPDVVEFLPPSAKHVFTVLASDGPLTQKDIISRTALPPRTVRYALDRLRGEEMLEERFCFRDARQSLYSLIGMDGKKHKGDQRSLRA